MPNTASASVLPCTCAMPQSSRTIVTRSASAFRRTASEGACAGNRTTAINSTETTAAARRNRTSGKARGLGSFRSTNLALRSGTQALPLGLTHLRSRKQPAFPQRHPTHRPGLSARQTTGEIDEEQTRFSRKENRRQRSQPLEELQHVPKNIPGQFPDEGQPGFKGPHPRLVHRTPR